MNIRGHLKTVHRHRALVRKYCFRLGLYWQGLTHDLSKYSPTEFIPSVRYYQGNRSPNDMQRDKFGYSSSWMHHKGRNRHHYEYWTDMNLESRTYEPVPIPRKYLVEMVMDRRAACMVYEGEKYNPGSALAYLLKSREKDLMHPQTRRELEHILTMLRDEGEEKTFHYLQKHVLQGKPFPWEE